MDGMASIQEMAELDLNDPLFKTDAFMVYGFKVLQCRRTRRHDWRECPFAHPGEVARRRDPRLYTYVGIICPDAKQNSPCPRGDRCPYTHSLFEYWLHPTRYKTEFCSRGRQCTRPFCFFAHSETEMRPVDTEALLAVAMRPSGEVSPLVSFPPASSGPLDDVVAQTADLFQVPTFTPSPYLHASLGRNGFSTPGFGELGGLRAENGTSLLTRASTLMSPWDTIYENGQLDTMQLELQRRYSMSDAGNPSDVISRLGLGYLQQSAKQRLFRHDGGGFTVGGGGGVPTTIPLGNPAETGTTDLDSILTTVGRSAKSMDANLSSVNAEARLQAYLAERGHSLPTTLPQNLGSFY